MYHGDFDWSGVTIANGIVSRFGARTWRFDTSSYAERSKRAVPNCSAGRLRLSGTLSSLMRWRMLV